VELSLCRLVSDLTPSTRLIDSPTPNRSPISDPLPQQLTASPATLVEDNNRRGLQLPVSQSTESICHMSETTISPILALLALLALGASFVVTVSLTSPGATSLHSLIQHRGRWFAFSVAAISMVGSLYYSEIANFPPCDFCWYQRIAMYPLALILLIAAVTNDRRIARYVIPIAVIGIALSAYHVQLQLFPEQDSSCSVTIPCHTQWIDQFGFVSIPFMAGSGFLAILAIHLAIWRADWQEA